MAYAWPGNIRQLENAMERAVALSGGRGQVEVGDLPPEIQQASEAEPLLDGARPARRRHRFRDASSRDIEREVIRRSLERTNGNKGAAARLLNLKRTTLVEKLKRLERS